MASSVLRSRRVKTPGLFVCCFCVVFVRFSCSVVLINRGSQAELVSQVFFSVFSIDNHDSYS